MPCLEAVEKKEFEPEVDINTSNESEILHFCGNFSARAFKSMCIKLLAFVNGFAQQGGCRKRRGQIRSKIGRYIL